MKWMTIGALAAVMAASAWAQSDSDYQGYMKAVFAANGSMQKNIGAKSADAAADAKKLQDTFKMVEAFWQAKGASDAVGFAQKAQMIAGMVATDVGGGDFDKAQMDAKSIGAVCGGCHMAHREGSAGNFHIKQ
jgi:hypothetical protein